MAVNVARTTAMADFSVEAFIKRDRPMWRQLGATTRTASWSIRSATSRDVPLRPTRRRTDGSLGPHRSGLEREDRRPNLTNGGVEVFDRMFYAIATRLIDQEHQCALQAQADLKQPVDDGIVESPGDALLLVAHRDTTRIVERSRVVLT